MRAFIIFILTSFSSYAILNGKGEADNFAYVVPIGTLDSEQNRFLYFCSGVLIAPDVVLTAKTCTDKIHQHSNTILTPTNKICPGYFGSEQEKIIDYIQIKDNPKTIDSSLSLLMLEETLSEQVAILPRQHVFKNLNVGKKINIAGFGQAIRLSAFSDLDAVQASTYCRKRSGVSRFMGFKTSAEDIMIMSGVQNGALAYLGDEGGGVFLNINSETQSVRHLIGILSENHKVEDDSSVSLFLESHVTAIEDALLEACDNNERVWCKRKGLLFSQVKAPSHLLTRENEPVRLPRFNINAEPKSLRKKRELKKLQLKNLGCGCQST